MNLIGSLRRRLRALRSPASGGRLPAYRPQSDERMVALSPGKQITEPDEAEAMGMTQTARRMRGKRR